MKTMIVTSAIIQNEKDEYLVVQRPEPKVFAYYWEFPGGKLEAGETPEQALCREIYEEINLQIKPEDLVPFQFCTHQYDYGHITLLSFKCRKWTGELILKENQPDYKWLPLSMLNTIEVPVGNYQVLEALGVPGIPHHFRRATAS
jgi:8-oxo-dGTP diphosphatase